MFDIGRSRFVPRVIRPAPAWSASLGSAIGPALRSALLAMAVMVLVVAPAATPTSAGAGPTRLSSASVSPSTGTTDSLITFTVAYRNREGSPADWVRVNVAGSTRAMTWIAGDDWKQEVWFAWTGPLPAGTHAVTFQAMSRDRFDDSLDGGVVTITTPATPPPTPVPTIVPTQPPTPLPTSQPTTAPTPMLTPQPTNMPTPPPTPRPTAPPTSTPAVTAPAVTPRPQATATARPTDPSISPDSSAASTSPSPGTGSGAGPVANPETSPAASDGSIAGVVPDAPSSHDPSSVSGPGSGPGSADGDASAGDPTGAVTTPGGGTNGRAGGGDPIAAMASALTTVGLGRPHLPLGLLLTMTTTTSVVGAALAFSVFGKRRRDGEQPAPDEILAAAAASGFGAAGVATLVAGAGGSGATPPTPTDLELAMPRWRRPSLLEARRADPLRDATVTARLTFDHGLVGPLDGRERRLIRYSVVRLLDTPDELRGSEIGFLDSGDEVQLLEKRGVYWLVLCPDGRQGWIHKMTLGEATGESAPQTSPTATMPIDADTWTMGEDVDGDVLAAYLESRRRP